MKPKLIARLNAAIGEPLIRDLYLRRGRPQESVPAAPPAPEHDWQKTTLSPEENTRIEQTVAPLADPELRGRLRELLRLQARLAKARQES
jgi:hypothetical protein